MNSFIKYMTEKTYTDGVYMALTVDEASAEELRDFQSKHLEGREHVTDLHCTLIYSQKKHVGDIDTQSYTATATFKNFALFGPDNDILVMEIESEDIKKRNSELVKEYGFVSDFDEYRPHITLAYNCKDVEIEDFPNIGGEILLTDEVARELRIEG